MATRSVESVTSRAVFAKCFSLIVHFPFPRTRSRQTNSDQKYRSELFFLPSAFTRFPLCVRIVDSPSLSHQTTTKSIYLSGNTSRACTAVSNSANAIMASPKPRLVDMLPSVRTRPMKVIVLGLNRTGTMCTFFSSDLSPCLNLDTA